MPTAAFSPEALRRLLDDLARRLHERDVDGRMFLVGGAAMSLGHGGRRLTRDIDASYQPAGAIEAAALEMAREQGLRDDWLNSRAMAFLPDIDPGDRHVLAERPGLTIELASARVLLAMKMAAFRASDIPDLLVLFEELEIESPEEAARITRELYGQHSVVIADDADDDLRLQAEDVLERLARSKTHDPGPR